MNPMGGFIKLIVYAVQLVAWMVFADALLGWIPQVNRDNPIVVVLRQVTEPILKPIRKLLPPERTGNVDLSPLIAIVLLQFIATILAGSIH